MSTPRLHGSNWCELRRDSFPTRICHVSPFLFVSILERVHFWWRLHVSLSFPPPRARASNEHDENDVSCRTLNESAVEISALAPGYFVEFFRWTIFFHYFYIVNMFTLGLRKPTSHPRRPYINSRSLRLSPRRFGEAMSYKFQLFAVAIFHSSMYTMST